MTNVNVTASEPQKPAVNPAPAPSQQPSPPNPQKPGDKASEVRK